MFASAPLHEGLRPYLRRFQRDQIRNLYRHEVNSLVGHFLAFALVTAFKAPQLPPWLAAGWGGAVLGALALRAAVLWRYRKRSQMRGDAADLYWHTIAISACALAWSAGLIAAFPHLGSGDRAFMMMVLAGITAGALFSLSPRLSSYALFSGLLLVPPITALFVAPRPGDVATASMATLFLVFCAAGVRKTNVLSARSMLRSYQNQEMMRDLRRARDELQESWARSQAANDAKQQFLANVSHEIRTPLNGILGMSDLMLGTRLDEEQEQCMTTLKRCGSSLLGLIDDLLDFSKIEAGRVEIEHVPYDLFELCNDVVTVHGLIAQQSGSAEVRLRLDEDVPHQIVGDPTRVRQVLNNLMGNAVKFTELGEVVLHVSRREREGGDRLLLSVEDEGIGIPPDRLEAIFESFTQADGTTTRNYGGTGLGLTISLRLAELMHGTLDVESEVGRGSTFTLELPLEPAGDETHAVAPAVLLLGGRPEVAESLRAAGACVTAPTLDATAWKRARAWLERQVGGVVVLGPDLGTAERATAHTLARECRAVLAATSCEVQSEDLTTLPMEEGPEALTRALAELMQRAQELAQGTPRPLEILVAEDDPTNARITRHLLERDGHSVRQAGDGAAAVAAVRERVPDLVLMDCQMPRMDGFAATRALRALPAGRSLPIVALTAHSGDDITRRCRAAGMNGHLEKPVAADRLRALLTRWGARRFRREEPAAPSAAGGDHEDAQSGKHSDEESVAAADREATDANSPTASRTDPPCAS